MGPLGGDSLNETVCVLSSDVRPDKVARSRKQRPQPLRFAVGSRVQAQWKSSGDMFPARVVKGNAAVGMYHLKYDDGDEDIAGEFAILSNTTPHPNPPRPALLFLAPPYIT